MKNTKWMLILILQLPIILIFTNKIHCQETIKIKNKITSHKIEVYYVLKDNKEIKHGQYQVLTGKKKSIRIAGYYKNNQKDSLWVKLNYMDDTISKGHYLNDQKTGLWIEFGNSDTTSIGCYLNDQKTGNWTYYSSGKLYEVGEYTNGKRQGTWNFYRNGVLAQQYDFEKDTMINIVDSLVPKFNIKNGKYSGLIHVDRDAYYGQSQEDIFSLIGEYIKYPREAINKRIEGRVMVKCYINLDGILSDFQIVKGIGGGCDEEAIRVLKLSNGGWHPAVFEGEPVPQTMLIPITFKLY